MIKSIVMINLIELESKLKNIIPKGCLEFPPDTKFGHVSFNGFMIDKSQDAKNSITNLLNSFEYIERYEVVGGFLNIFFKKNQKIKNDNINFGNGEKKHIEYCSPNPTGDLHLGHFRNIILGFCLSNIFKITGYDVTTEIYINDQGNQMNQFIETVKHWDYSFKNQNDNPYRIFYKGEYVKEITENLKDKEISRNNVVNILEKMILKTLEKMRIKFDVLVYESSFRNKMDKLIERLKEENLIYVGQMENQKIKENQLILKTKELGLEEDSVLQRANGEYSYYAYDIAYHIDKKERGFSNQIIVLGEDHIGHINKLKIILKKIANIELEVLKYHTFHLIKNEKIIP
ncbi:MAG: arginine--tRNA ligase, partial [Bacteroidota bacterium]